MLKRLEVLFLSLFVTVFILLSYTLTYGLDIDLYTVTGQEVPPNVLIILDNSSSMTTEDQPPDYNPNPPALPPVYPGSYLTNAVYSKQSSDWVLFTDDVNNIVCANAKDMLTVYGTYNGKMNNSNFNCTGKTMFLQTGNYMNYLSWTTTSNQPRLGLAKGTLHSYINTTDGVRFGLMVFNANGQGGRVTAPISDDKRTLFDALNDITPPTVVDWTPLAETLYEAMLHFRGGPSYYNQGTTYDNSTLQQYWCQKNYVILITDGAPTYDVQDDPSSPITNQIGNFPKIGDYDKDGNDPGTYTEFGSHYLDDVAEYIHENDVSSILTGRQNITLFTIGFNPSQFAIDSTLLQSAATKGGGKYFYCHNAQSFKIAFQLIIEEVLSKSTSFVAPTVPISQMEKMASSDRIYLAMFKPTERSFWKGNVKKFGIAESNDPTKGIVVGDVLDKDGNLAIDPQLNAIYDTAFSHWSTVEDGGEVEKGGVGKILLDMPDLFQRKIYTYLGGTNKYLKDTSNAFTATNISAALLDLPNDDEKNKLINFVYGYDSYDQNGNGVIDEKRSWVLGGFIHSRPLIVPYPSGTVIFVGGNDGMLHAFDDNSGTELWAFIPRDLLPKLKNLSGDTVEFFVDGSPKIYIETDPDGTVTTAILICGERRGGDHYFALNVKDPLNPQWLWEIHPALADYTELGQTWSSPLLGKIKRETNDQWVFFIGGGYDTNQDKLPVTGNDTKGRAIYVGDVLTGERIWKYSYADNALMKYSIPSDITRVDTNGDGKIDRLYVGDMGGQIWRFNIEDPLPSNWTGKCIFNSNDPPPESGDRRKIFYPPDVSLELDWAEYELLLFGTGDREHPKNKGVTDRLYTLKDRDPGAVLNDSHLVDVTEGLLQSSSTSDTDKKTILNDLKTKSGWYIKLDPNSGEKCISPALIFFKISYFSTFIPCTEVTTDPCYLGEGLARLYALNYLNGNAVFNFDLSNDLGGEILTEDDRSMLIGTAIPSGTIIAIIGGTTTTGYIGIGGGIFKAPLKSSKVLIPVNWRQKF